MATGAGGKGDDQAVLFLAHGRQYCQVGKDGAVEIHVYHLLPLVYRVGFEQSETRYGGIIDQHIDPAVFGQCLCDGGINGGVAGNIDLCYLYIGQSSQFIGCSFILAVSTAHTSDNGMSRFSESDSGEFAET